MLFRLESDLHITSPTFKIQRSDNEADTILLLAGDICNSMNEEIMLPFFTDVCERFDRVVYVPGNHESYWTDGPDTISYFFRGFIVDNEFTNLSFLQKNTITVDNRVAIIGATLWTDCNKGNPLTDMYLRTSMNDFAVIGSGESDRSVFTPVESARIHAEHRDYIFSSIVEAKKKGLQVVVMTHHAPSYLSVADRFVGDPITPGFVSDLDQLILDTEPDIWVHGHTHEYFDYYIDQTRVLCNPYGYDSINGKESTGYKLTLFEL